MSPLAAPFRFNRRLSSFRRLPQNATALMPNCLDFGWPSRHLQKGGSLARTRGNGDCPRNYLAPRGVESLSPRPNHDRPRDSFREGVGCSDARCEASMRLGVEHWTLSGVQRR